MKITAFCILLCCTVAMCKQDFNIRDFNNKLKKLHRYMVQYKIQSEDWNEGPYPENLRFQRYLSVMLRDFKHDCLQLARFTLALYSGEYHEDLRTMWEEHTLGSFDEMQQRVLDLKSFTEDMITIIDQAKIEVYEIIDTLRARKQRKLMFELNINYFNLDIAQYCIDEVIFLYEVDNNLETASEKNETTLSSLF